jgi:hypothetical protein
LKAALFLVAKFQSAEGYLVVIRLFVLLLVSAVAAKKGIE